MYLFKPQHPAGKKFDEFYFFCHTDKLKADSKPAKPGIKKEYVLDGKNTIEYRKFPKNTVWWNLEKFFAEEDIAGSYLTIHTKDGFKETADSNGLVIRENGQWNCCTVLPYLEYRVAKVVAVEYDKNDKYHRYNLHVYLELPVASMLEIAKDETLNIKNKLGRAFKGAVKGAAQGWKHGWYRY